MTAQNLLRPLAALIAAMTAWLMAGMANAQDQIALVIGNESYGQGLEALPYAATDARQIAEALSGRGFVSGVDGADLSPAIDLDRESLVSTIQAFDARLDEAPEGTVAILYFAGHGVAQERRGDVYLLPTDAQFSAGVALDTVGVPLSDVLQLLRSHKDRTVIVIVDACRNVPPLTTVSGARSVTLAEGAGSGWGDDDGLGSRGLGLLTRGATRDFSVATPEGADYFVAFSTSPDRAAYDNDLFSSILADEIDRGRHDVLTLFKSVGERMAEESRAQGALQLPTYEVGIYNNPPCFGICPPESDPNRFFDCPGCPWMRVVEPGAFTYGSPPGEEGRDRNERAAMQAQITRPFAISEYEVTRAEWLACERAGYCEERTNQMRFLSERAPITHITLDDATAFLRWLSAQSGQTYRLPTDAEWEYAARGGRDDIFPFGDEVEPALAAYDYSASYNGSHRAEYRGQPETGGSFPPNEFHLYDMAGNVWEWALDCAEAGSCTETVLRSGSYKSPPADIRTANRFTIRPNQRREDVGLRVVREIAG